VRDARPWTYAALLGSLWGAAEVSLGALLNASRVPLGGLLMAAIGVVCLVTARRLRPAIGASLAMGTVVAFLKVFSLGGFVLGPVVGILTESLAVELAMTLTASRWPGAVAGGALALASAPAWLVASALVLTPAEARLVLERAARIAARFVGWQGGVTAPVVAAALVVAACLGAIIGAFAWRLAGRVSSRVAEGS
jgi:hypothetical protein